MTGMRVNCGKTAELIQTPFVKQTLVGYEGNHVLDGGPGVPHGKEGARLTACLHANKLAKATRVWRQ